MSWAAMQRALKSKGTAMKAETITAHFRECLDGNLPVITSENYADVQQMRGDFAILVQRKATEMLEAGTLRVTATHGLQAQALLDKRAEKAADRDVALNIARLLSGAMVPAPMKVVSGEGYDIMLAPPELVSD